MPALITRYVNVNSPTGGNGTTPSTASGDPNRAYSGYSSSLSAERAVYGNLVASDAILKIECAGGVDIMTEVHLPAFTTDYDRYVWLYSSPENSHTGVWDTTKYTIAGTAATIILVDNILNLRLDGIQIENRSTNGVWSIMQNVDATTQNRSLHIDRCFLRSISGSGNNGSAIGFSYIIRKSIRVTNTIIQGAFNDVVFAQYVSSGSRPCVIYNNTMYGCISGIDARASADEAQWYIKNNIISCSGSGAAYMTGSNTTASNNISSDFTSPNPEFRNLVPAFISTISQSANFQLSNDDVVAKDKGVTLTTDSIYSISTDIAGTRRPSMFSAWDIGAFENLNGRNKSSATNANIFIDNFNRADGAIGGNYDTAAGFTAMTVNSNAARGNSDLSLSSIKTSVVSFNTNQRSQVTYNSIIGFDFAGPAVRVNATNGTGYILHLDAFGGNERRLSRITGSVRTTIGTTNLLPVNGDVFVLEVSGNILRVYKNNTLVATETDNTYTSGQPGLYYKLENSNATRLDNFIASDVPTTSAKTLFTISPSPQQGKLIQGNS